MTPEQPNRVKGLFDEGPGTVAGVLEKPGSFRYAGWDLQTLDQAHIENGQYLELNNGARKRLRLYEDGTLIARGSIDEDFLGWAPMDHDFQKHPRVHSLAITEFTAAFVYLYKRILAFLDRAPTQINFHVEIADGKVGDRMLYISPYAVNTYGWHLSEDEYSLKKENIVYDGVLSTQDLKADPDRIAFLLIERLFLFFSVPSNKVPYTIEVDGNRKVNIAQIVKTQ
jgi:hypothetical protein